MRSRLRLPDTWTAEEADFLLDLVNELNNAILEQYGDVLYRFWNHQQR